MDNTIFEANENTLRYHLLGAVGAFLGAILGAIPWAIVSLAGWFVAWLGFLIGFLSKKGYELLGGKIGKQKIWIVCIASVFGVIFGSILSDFLDFGQLIYNGEITGVTYSDIPQLYIYWISDFEVLRSVLMTMGIGLFFGLLGIFSIFKELRQKNPPSRLNQEENSEM